MIAVEASRNSTETNAYVSQYCGGSVTSQTPYPVSNSSSSTAVSMIRVVLADLIYDAMPSVFLEFPLR